MIYQNHPKQTINIKNTAYCNDFCDKMGNAKTHTKYTAKRENGILNNLLRTAMSTAAFAAFFGSLMAAQTPIAPSVTEQPEPVTIQTGGTPAKISVSVNGTGPFTYTWQKEASEIMTGTQPPYTLQFPGNNQIVSQNQNTLNTDTLTIPVYTAAAGGVYNCVISNSAGSVTSQGVDVLVTPAPNTINNAQLINVSPGPGRFRRQHTHSRLRNKRSGMGRNRERRES